MRMSVYIVVMSFIFALLDWSVISTTRLQNREWLDWMHSHEKQYQVVTQVIEYTLCTPALALKPIFYHSIVSSVASQEQQASILHVPKPDLKGFYHLLVRGESWTFVSWTAWFIYWLPQAILWLLAVEKIRRML
jgi:hypothetical protein